MDAVLLEGLSSEWRQRLRGARVDRVTSPDAHRIEIVFFGGRTETVLAFVLVPQAALVSAPARPRKQAGQPTAFAMLLRRRLGGFRLLDVDDPGLDRTLTLRLGGRNEFGDEEERRIVFEGYGPRPNLLLVGADGRITDAFRRVPPDADGLRGRLPGLAYDPGKRSGPERIDPRTLDLAGLWDILCATDAQGRAAETLTRGLRGIAPLWAREILVALGIAPDARGANLPDRMPFDKSDAWAGFRDVLGGTVPDPGMALAGDGRVLGAFAFRPRQYGAVSFERFPTLTQAVSVAVERIETARVLEARRSALVREVRRRRARLLTRLGRQDEEWRESERDLAERHRAELIMGNLYRIPDGAREVWVEDWETEEDGDSQARPEDSPLRVRIELDPAMSARDFAQRLFTRYQKAKRRQAALSREVDRGRTELAYMDGLEDAAERAPDLEVLDALAREAEAAGTLSHPARPKHARKAARSEGHKALAFQPLRYRTPGGFEIWVGRTASENDRLTLYEADAEDLWFHVTGGAGAHVILRRGGPKAPGEEDLVAAAMLAAYHSPQARSSHVEIASCHAGKIRRVPGGRPGLVLYDRERSYSVTPDANEVAAMRLDVTADGSDAAYDGSGLPPESGGHAT